MKTSLSREHRRTLERTVAAARIDAEAGAEKALQALAVGAAQAPEFLNDAQRALAIRLRAHARQLGDPRGEATTQTTARLLVEIAYEHWHRMLFARFLAASDLLMHPDGYPVSLADCKDDAATLVQPAGSRTPSAWEVAGRYASAMLPNVFRSDSPALALELPLESQQALERHLAALPADVFDADDSLGWSYQFWQAPRKEAVQRQMKNAGSKVGAEELPAVTQLFTEPYMVAFLLENALGAWWHRTHAGQPLPVAMPYLRMAADGQPAAGPMAGWPQVLTEFRVLDPALGSGHFLVSALQLLVPVRMAAEGLSARDAVDKVLAENLHGLELDARCVEIAAFALALAAWRYPGENGLPLGVRPLPRLNIACCGLAPQSEQGDWLALAGGDARLEAGMAKLYALFQTAPELGSLIDPASVSVNAGLFDASWSELARLLDAALAGEAMGDGGTAITEAGAARHEAAIAAQGMAVATRLLSQRYHWVITNPPYLGAGQHGQVLKKFCESNYPAAKADLANVFLDRSLQLCEPGGVLQFVIPQNWLSLGVYEIQRGNLLRTTTWNLLAWIAEHGFDSDEAAGAEVILITLTRGAPLDVSEVSVLDAIAPTKASEKALRLLSAPVINLSQSQQLRNPDSRFALNLTTEKILLSNYADAYKGLSSGDLNRFIHLFWEHNLDSQGWIPYQGSVDSSIEFGGRSQTLLWENGCGVMVGQPSCYVKGTSAWGKRGITVTQMRRLSATIYQGEYFDENAAAVIPFEEGNRATIYCFICSPEFHDEVRKLDSSKKVTNKTLVKVPFDISRWQQIAADRYPDGLPQPYSNDPTQWIFHGHPKPATDPLQVAVARLLGYFWPAENDADMELSDEARTWIARCAELDDLGAIDGIVCLPSVRGEASAVDRLRELLARAFGTEWSAAHEAALLRDAGCDGLPLSQWLRDKFFAQHLARFQKRPFIWHVWDGHKDGFAALVNVHTLTRAKLQTLIHTYLGDWITQQKRAVDAGDGDATLRLARAQTLNDRLEAILEGEAPHDIFVRWKPAHAQAIGWEPDMNDGVRMNIRPFVLAEVLRLPARQIGIRWEPDRGKDVASAPWFGLGPAHGEPVGTRINNHHLTLAEKHAARKVFSAGLPALKAVAMNTAAAIDDAELDRLVAIARKVAA